MFLSPRKSNKLVQLEFLKRRMVLGDILSGELYREENGFLGECYFAELVSEILDCEHIPLYNLQLLVRNAEKQIDCVVILPDEILLFEVKHYRGDYHDDGENWIVPSGENKIDSPFKQLNSAANYLNRLLKFKGLEMKVSPFLILTGPEFYLYNHKSDINAVFPTQIRGFLRKINEENRFGGLTRRHHEIAEMLKSYHIERSRYEVPLEYQFEKLKKGIPCAKCDGWMERVERKNMKCKKCGNIEESRQAILRCIEEFQKLFPDEKLTTAIVYEWVGKIFGISMIRCLLNKYFVKQDNARSTFYIKKE